MAADRGSAIDGRKVLLGAGATLAVGIAVASTMLVSNAMALGNVAGRPIAVRPMTLPAAPTVTPHAPADVPAPAATTAQLVPAPAPHTVTVRPSAAPHPTPTASVAESEVIAHFLADGDWDAVLDWVAAQGWSRQQAVRWIDRLRAQQEFSDVAPSFGADVTPTPARTGSRSHRSHPRGPTGSQEDQSTVSPDGSD